MKKFVFLFTVLFLTLAMILFAGCVSQGDDENGDCYDLSNPLMGYRLTSDPDPVYDGKPKTRNFVLTFDGAKIDTVDGLSGNSDLQLEYVDNINAGMAKIIVKPVEGSTKYKGEIIIEFPILASAETMSAEDFNQLKSLLSNANYQSIELTSEITVPEKEELNIPKGVKVSLNTFTLKNQGKIVNQGEIYFKEKDDEKVFAYNNGHFENQGKIYLGSNSAFFNKGEFVNSDGGEVIAGGMSGFYSDVDIVNQGYMANYYRRYPIEDFELTLSFAEADYTGKALCPGIIAKKDGVDISYGDYNAVYADNINAGRACVTVTASEFSKTMTGSTVLYFDINKIETTASNVSQLTEKLANDNYSAVMYYGILLNEPISIPHDKTVTFAKNIQIRSEVTANGTIIFNDGLSLSGTFINNGKTDLGNKNFVNGGNISNSGTLICKGNFTNNKLLSNTGNISVEKNFYNKGTIDDDGQMSISEKLYNGADCEVSSVDGIDVGTAYVDEDCGTFNGNIVVRQNISEEDIVLDTIEFTYDSLTKKAYPVFLKIQPNTGAYSYSYRYVGDYQDSSQPVNAGKVAVTVTFGLYSEYYKGSCVLYYDILPGKCTVNNIDEIKEAFANPNYDTVELGYKCNLENELEIPEGYTLIIPSDMYMVNKSVINIYGTLENYGRYADNDLENTFVLAENGRFINSGEAYFNETQPVGCEGDGVVYVRKSIKQTTTVNFNDTVNYTQFPEVFLEDNGVPLETDVDYMFYHIDGSYATPDGKTAKAVSIAANFSQKYYGTKIDEYRVLAISVEISNLDELIIALESRHPEEDYCNYSEIILKNSIVITNENYPQSLTLRVAPNTTIVTGNYSLEMRSAISDKIYFINNGNILTLNKIGLKQNENYSGNGKITGYASTADDLKEYAQCMDAIILTADIDNAIIQPYGADCTLDLNGHAINKLQVNFDYNSLEIVSTVEGGRLGSADSSDFGLYAAAGDGETTLTLKNITVYGIKHLYPDENRLITDSSCTLIEKT